MSSIYNLEPPCSGHITFQTTHGPLDIRLWSAQTPQTCTNFIQHCLNGYYDQLPFHRIVPDLLIQTGDRTSSGHGGQVAVGNQRGVPREIARRLKFRRRGLVAMVADDEGFAKSQFFITLSKTDWLDAQHTIFGQVVGDTIYNVLNIAATGERSNVDESAPKILSVTIHHNPFPHLEPQKLQASTQPISTKETAKKAVRNSKLLSFGNDSDSGSDHDDKKRPLKRAQSKRKPVRALNPSITSIHPEALSRSSIHKHSHNSVNESQNVHKSKNDDRTEVVRKANEEFERLKAELAGHKQKPGKADGKNVVEDEDKEDETDAVCRAMAEVTTEDEREERRGKKRQRKDEEETLRKLKVFEGKVMKARRGGNTASNSKMWFAQRLNLPAVAVDDEEYEIRMPKGAPFKARRR